MSDPFLTVRYLNDGREVYGQASALAPYIASGDAEPAGSGDEERWNNYEAGAEVDAAEMDSGVEEAEAPAEIDATDAASELAQEHGIDLADVEGTGADGRILKSDIEALVEEG